MININGLQKALEEELQQYHNDVNKKVETAKEEVTKELVSTLKQHPSPKLTGNYRKGWRIKRVGNKIIVHNKTNYQLTHLLEHGHAKVGGGRVPPIVHIRPAEEKAVDDFVKKLERGISS
ncbi:HK97 gp10 family phage protein [Cytobacillus sp. IB215316]|uniref:HK97 gp10 family phage protein n=1 Tax=Cytobacillus sp. IB215316 TaxID=3097354 RepID=UPI002A185ECB|nr:HK97 gp10 family phage protein [Cytobacillus sp. IB215316]MDX8359824.1 HK97 gp10 family phage protein [Cytobacillus sp. IB215316]